MRPTRRTLLAAPALLLAASARAAGVPPRDLNHTNRIALRGYDTVAWHLQARPRRGSPAFRTEHGGAAWHFATADHLARFRADRAAFVPRYGGFCAFGIASGYKVDIDPEAWTVADGVLYLNYDRGVQRQWLRDMSSLIARADANWPGLADA